MEKIEKILLLAVLGVALLIVGVMAFLPKDIETAPERTSNRGAIYDSMSEGRGGYLSDVDFGAGSGTARAASGGGEEARARSADAKRAADARASGRADGDPGPAEGGAGLGAASHDGTREEAERRELAEGGSSAGVGGGEASSRAGLSAGSGGDVTIESEGRGSLLEGPAAINAVPAAGAEIALSEITTHPRHPQYALYRVQANDSLSSIVQAFCVSGEGTLDAILKVNERLVANPDRLREGEEIMIPKRLVLSRDERIRRATERAARRRFDSRGTTRRASRQNAGRASASKTASKTAAKAGTRRGGRAYTVKRGESLWVIATREVGSRSAAKFIERVRQLNPGLEPKNIRENGKIYLPNATWVREHSKKR